MNCSLCAAAGTANAVLASTAAPATCRSLVVIIVLPRDRARPGSLRGRAFLSRPNSNYPWRYGAMERDPGSIRERPKPELFLGDGPQPGEAVRLHDQEEHDQEAEQHELDVRDCRRRQADAEDGGKLVEENGGENDEGGPEE